MRDDETPAKISHDDLFRALRDRNEAQGLEQTAASEKARISKLAQEACEKHEQAEAEVYRQDKRVSDALAGKPIGPSIVKGAR